MARLTARRGPLPKVWPRGRRTGAAALAGAVWALVWLLALDTAPVSAASAGAAPRFVLKEVIVNPSGLLDADELQAAWAPYLGREIGLDELNAIVDEINARYAARHLITAKAVLPPQTIHDGVVHIQLIEGRIGAIVVQGNHDTSARYITARIGQKPGDLARPDRLQAAITRFNHTNDVQMRAELKPGAAFGTTDIVLIVKEPPPWSVSVVADNTGRGETGIGRISETWTNHSLFGRSDPLVVTGTISAGTQAGSLSYELPITLGGTRLGLSASASDVSLIGGDLKDAGVAASANGYGLSLSHPFAATPSLQVDGTLSWQVQTSQTELSGTTLLDTDQTTVQAALRAKHTDPSRPWYLGLTYTGGRVETDPPTPFATYALELAWQRPLAAGHRLVYHALVQTATERPVPAGAQFSLGGGSTLRGYAAGTVQGDGGYLLSAELHGNTAAGNDVYGFIDLGGALAFKGAERGLRNPGSFTSIGVGATLRLANTFNLNLVAGIPLDPGAWPRGWLGRLYASIQLDL